MNFHAKIKNQELTPSRAFMAALCDKIGQPPNDENRYVIGAAAVSLGPQWADTVYIATMRTPDKWRGKGYAGFAMDEIASIADQFGVTLKTDCSGVSDPKKGLPTDALRGMCERRHFVSTGAYEMTRLPR